ncbi:hypothetical protein ACJ41O_004011 [Fusarium nematophilum]
MAPGGLPTDPEAWRTSADEYSLTDGSIHTRAMKKKSASKIGIQQFLLLRALWPDQQHAKDFKADCLKNTWISANTLETAKRFLQTLDSWKNCQPKAEETLPLASEPPSQPKVDFSPRPDKGQPGAHRDQHSHPETPTREPKATDTGEDMAGVLEDLDLEEDSPNIFSSPLGILSPHSPATGDIAKQYQAVKDEQIVNTALILLLNSLTLHCDTARGE